MALHRSIPGIQATMIMAHYWIYYQYDHQDLDEEEDLPPHPKPHVARRLMDPDTRSIDSDDYQEFESYQSQQMKGTTGKEQAAPASAVNIAC